MSPAAGNAVEGERRQLTTIAAVAISSDITSGNLAAGTKVSTEKTPSRDSHEVFHWEKARQARSGRPRCSTDELRPATASMVAFMTARPDIAGMLQRAGVRRGG